MQKDRKLILIGDSAFAEVAHEYFTHDSPYEVVAFAVERAFLTRTELFGKPVVPLEELPERYAPADHSFYAALVYTQLNRLRARLYRAAKEMGYRPASYVSPRAFVWRNVELGEHCFVFENNVIQPFVKIGANVVLWSGNHIGHHSAIAEHCFISSHVVVSGFCTVGAHCFFGVNATLGNNVTVGADCLLGAGATVVKDVPADTLVRGTLSDLSKPISARRFSKVPEAA
ncbi:acetyltransferase [Gemmata sp. JC673]|uniref:Acetyltransferase n=1 Tax=Gemmata algarum TaxID=2975278 RepID=A0ABU5EUT9_9BACT|nr:acetyltransferase [Gemmata algarum]MDY3559068.1 acetyltransferase [Gemmata algarum]